MYGLVNGNLLKHNSSSNIIWDGNYEGNVTRQKSSKKCIQSTVTWVATHNTL